MQKNQMRVGIISVVDGKVGFISPKPGTGNYSKDWMEHKEPEWEFIPIHLPSWESWCSEW
jgi:hypothetical protein